MKAADLTRAALGLGRATRIAVRQGRGRHAPWEATFDHTPRPCPAGLVCRPPEFVGIGAQKSGTSWWYDLICAHPAVYRHPAFHKERHFLSAAGVGGSVDEAQVSRYAEWFPRPPGQVSGEWTPDYLYYHWVPTMLRQAAPSAKLIVLLRDPIDRFLSGLVHQEVNGSGGVHASEEEAYQRGLYAVQLARWESAFPSEQMLVMQYERCLIEPETHIRLTYRFLGLEDDFMPAAVRGLAPAKSQKPTLTSARRQLLRDLYAPDVAALAARYPQIDLSLWPSSTGLVQGKRSETSGEAARSGSRV